GSHNGIEKELIGNAFPNLPFHGISSGKLRRYFSTQNFTDPFRVIAGVMQAFKLIKKIKPSVIFSKGGFVSVPVVIAAKLANVPVVSHESDVTPGLANKIALPFASHVFTVFKETMQHLPSDKATCTGSVIRSQLFTGNIERGLQLCGFTSDKKVILVMGGSLGSVFINDALRNNLDYLLKEYQVIHLCGKGNIDEKLEGVEGYKQFEYVTTELPDLLYAANYVISRAGSNSIFEFVALHKPMLLIPLSAEKSRGDQILNAKLFKSQGLAQVLFEEDLNDTSFKEAVMQLIASEDRMIDRMLDAEAPKTPKEMVDLILQYEK
ncbi:MAG: undecaprenyldiphospho-muramoylpentapeptide beta-N-acetylglucosaminyltransferase, partial [Lysinibacillus sp.]